jgi:hypothetical protein
MRDGMLTDEGNRNDAGIRARQSEARVVPGKTLGNDVSGYVERSERETTGTIDNGRRQVSEDAGTLSENYSATVRAGKVSPNHGGNRAVWDTIGANAGTPQIGTPPKRGPIGEWHFGEDGVPAPGPIRAEHSAPGRNPSGTPMKAPGE